MYVIHKLHFTIQNALFNSYVKAEELAYVTEESGVFKTSHRGVKTSEGILQNV